MGSVEVIILHQHCSLTLLAAGAPFESLVESLQTPYYPPSPVSGNDSMSLPGTRRHLCLQTNGEYSVNVVVILSQKFCANCMFFQCLSVPVKDKYFRWTGGSTLPLGLSM